MTKNRNRRNKRSHHPKPTPNSPQATNPLIAQVKTVLSEEKPTVENPEKTTSSWFSRKLYLIYGGLWFYFIIKAFVVDVEAWMFELVGAERYQMFLGLRIFIAPCLIAVSITWKGYKVVLRHIFHFLTVPFYFTVFLFAKSVYYSLVNQTIKRENATFLVFLLEILGRVLSRFNYYLFSLLGVSTLIICTFYPSDRPIQFGAFSISLVLVGAVMYQSVLKVIQPLKIFGFFKIDEIILYSKRSKSILPKPKYGDSKPKSRREAIRELLFSHILVTVLQKNVSEVREKKSFLIVAFADFFVLILTITTFFTFLNYSLFLIMPESFGGQSNPGFGDFAFYSFYAIPGEGTSIEPVGDLSKIIKVVTTCYGYYLFIFLATILLGVFSEKFTQALESISDFLQQQSKVSEPKLSSMLGIPIDVLRDMSLSKLVKLIDLVKDEKAKST